MSNAALRSVVPALRARIRKSEDHYIHDRFPGGGIKRAKEGHDLEMKSGVKRKRRTATGGREGKQPTEKKDEGEVRNKIEIKNI